MIRLAQFSDYENIYNWYMDADINRYLLYDYMPREKFLPIFENLIQTKVLYIFEHNFQSVGMFKLVPMPFRNKHIIYLGGVAISNLLANQGLGTKMLSNIVHFVSIQKKYLRIELTVATENTKAIRVYEKVGFVKEGILKRFTYLADSKEFLDEQIMAFYLF